MRNTTDKPKKACLIVFALLVFALATLNAEPQMGVSYVGSFSFPSGSNRAVFGMEGDILVVHDHSIQNRTIIFDGGAMAPNGTVTPMHTTFSYEVPSAWGDIWEYPHFCEFKHGKLFTAWETDAKLLVFFTSSQGTEVHAFDRTGMPNIFAVNLFNENTGYISASRIVDNHLCIYSLDFSTHHMLQIFEASALYNNSPYYLMSFMDDYLFAYQWTFYDVGEQVLFQNGVVMQLLYDIDWGFSYAYYYTQRLCGTHYFTVGSGNLDKENRQNSRSIIAWIQNNQLGYFILDEGFENTGPDMILYAIPQSDSTFTCLYYPAQNNYKNFRVSNHDLILDDFFPNLSGFTGLMAQFKMDEDYTVALSRIDASNYKLILVDNPHQGIRNYDFAIPNLSPYTQNYQHSERYLYWLTGYSNARTAQIFHLELESSTQDEAIPKPVATMLSYPNPFSSVCRVKVDNPSSNMVGLEVYNLKGQLIKALHKGYLTSGTHCFYWDAKDNHNQDVSAGIYLLKLDSGNITTTSKVILLR